MERYPVEAQVLGERAVDDLAFPGGVFSIRVTEADAGHSGRLLVAKAAGIRPVQEFDIFQVAAKLGLVGGADDGVRHNADACFRADMGDTALVDIGQ